MKAVVYEAFQSQPVIQNVPDPAPANDGVVIQVEANGICRSDWHGWMGHDPDIVLPHVPGHELAGVIIEAGKNVKNWTPGNRVTVPFAVGCGHCIQCLAGNQHICDDYFQPGFTAWGSFAQYVAVVHQGRTQPGHWVVVHGCGGVGLSAVMIAYSMGAQVIGVDIKDDNLDLAKELGAVYTINARKVDNVIDAIHSLTHGGADVSIDALGSLETCRNSVLSLKKRGRHIQVGLMVADYKNASIPMNVVIGKELELLGSHGMQAHAYPPMIDMIQSGQLQPEKLIRKRVNLSQSIDELLAMGEFGQTGVTVIDQF